MIVATVRRVLYRNKNDGYTVLFMSNGADTFTAVCNLPFSPEIGQEVKLEGQWVDNPKYGRQFKATGVYLCDPTTESGIIEYLSSGQITGIGPVIAKRIIDTFGSKTLQTLDENPQMLLNVKGIGEKLLDKICESWKKAEGTRTIINLCGMGLTVNQAIRIYGKYKDNSVAVVKKNPYNLAGEIWGIGFKKADEIAQNMGFAKNHPFRVKSGILYVLKESTNQGHCFLPEGELKSESAKILGVEDDLIQDILIEMGNEGHLVTESINDELVYYLPTLYYTERYIEKRLRELTSRPYRALRFEPDTKVNGYTLLDGQLKAATIAVRSYLSVITGSAGTGKTTTLMAIINCLEKNNLTYALCAPTGKAAKRMSEVTRKESKTIHRLLEVDRTGEFKRNEENPLDCDYVIVDEASMIDIFLMANLLRAIPESCSLILIGDHNQLPPVGAGNIFRDIIKSGVCPVAILTEIQRQGSNSSIIRIANDVKHGEVPFLGNSHDFYLLEMDDPEKITEKVVELVVSKIQEKLGIDPANIQVISPMRKGLIGVDNLNRLIQGAIHKGNEVPELNGFKLGDRVMQITNNYKKDVFNGDVGHIVDIDIDNGTVVVRYGENDVQYFRYELDELTLAYCCTVHKYQGSEAKCIVFPLHTQHYIMLKRNLIYTAVTRARDVLIMIGTKKALTIGVKNDTEQKRYTGLFLSTVKQSTISP